MQGEVRDMSERRRKKRRRRGELKEEGDKVNKEEE